MRRRVARSGLVVLLLAIGLLFKIANQRHTDQAACLTAQLAGTGACVTTSWAPAILTAVLAIVVLLVAWRLPRPQPTEDDRSDQISESTGRVESRM